MTKEKLEQAKALDKAILSVEQYIIGFANSYPALDDFAEELNPKMAEEMYKIVADGQARIAKRLREKLAVLKNEFAKL